MAWGVVGVNGGVTEATRVGSLDPIPLQEAGGGGDKGHRVTVGTYLRGLDSQESGELHEVHLTHVTHDLVHAVKWPAGTKSQATLTKNSSTDTTHFPPAVGFLGQFFQRQ